MADKKMAPLLLNVDASEVFIQFEELLKLVELPTSFSGGIPKRVAGLFFDRVHGLIDSIVLSDFATTISTTDAGGICLKVKIIGLVEHLAPVIRAHGSHGLHRYTLFIVGEVREQVVPCYWGMAGSHTLGVAKNPGTSSSSAGCGVLISL